MPDNPTRGTVSRWLADEGWGVIESPNLPGGCAFSADAIERTDLPGLRAGHVVQVTWEQPGEHGYPFRATRVDPNPNLQETPGG
ncbi:MAG: hypothetical protein M3P83_08655 [Actinomycetota bacterium]|nr:hypothetical protein [Actinomycetota bacterium]